MSVLRLRLILAAVVSAAEALEDGDSWAALATLRSVELDLAELVALLERREAA